MPARHDNWTKWWLILLDATKSIPILFRTNCHTLLNNVHPRKRCCTDSDIPQSATHAISVLGIIPLRAKLSLVGNLLRNNCHANKETLEGQFLLIERMLWFIIYIAYMLSLYMATSPPFVRTKGEFYYTSREYSTHFNRILSISLNYLHLVLCLSITHSFTFTSL